MKYEGVLFSNSDLCLPGFPPLLPTHTRRLDRPPSPLALSPWILPLSLICILTYILASPCRFDGMCPIVCSSSHAKRFSVCSPRIAPTSLPAHAPPLGTLTAHLSGQSPMPLGPVTDTPGQSVREAKVGVLILLVLMLHRCLSCRKTGFERESSTFRI